ncbi:MAG: glycosyltransferase family 4 protein [Acidobacteria bacterium]|nr:glycosyltransferase family 4 protein [Acidobacteriota bacterium]
MFRSLLSGFHDAVVVVPRHADTTTDSRLFPVLRFCTTQGRRGTLLWILAALESCLLPLVVAIRTGLARVSVVIASQPIFSGVGAAIVSHLTGAPLIVLVHGEEIVRGHLTVRRRIWRALLNWVVSGSAAVICNSAETRRILIDAVGVAPERVHICYPELSSDDLNVTSDPQDISKVIPAHLDHMDMLLSVGRLWEEHKGFDTAIEALPRICADFPNTALVIAGPGDPTKLETLADQCGVRDHVVFAGEVERQILVELYRRSTMFVMPGRRLEDGRAEGFGMVYIEAALMHKPSIAGSNGGAPEAVLHGKTGLVVDGTAEEVSEAIKALLANCELRVQLGENAYRRAAEEFGSGLQAHKFHNIVRTVAASAALR